jgi:outer membrane lipoprotein SlyB
VTGAVLGALIAPPWRAGTGALVGAVLGGVVGGAAESAQNAQAAQVQTVQVQRQQTAQLERKAGDFKRAASACLEARGYSVR